MKTPPTPTELLRLIDEALLMLDGCLPDGRRTYPEVHTPTLRHVLKAARKALGGQGATKQAEPDPRQEALF